MRRNTSVGIVDIVVVETTIRPHEPRNVVVVVRARRLYAPVGIVGKVAVDVAVRDHDPRIVDAVARVRRS